MFFARLNCHFDHPSVFNYCSQHGVIIASDVELLHLLRRPRQSRCPGSGWLRWQVL